MKFMSLTVISLVFLISPCIASDLIIQNAWIREAPPVAKVHAAYMTLKNTGDKGVELTSAYSADYAQVMIHQSEINQEGLNVMNHLSSLTIPAGQSVRLQAGGIHLMLMKPKRKLKNGDTVRITLCYGDDQHQTFSFMVNTAGEIEND